MKAPFPYFGGKSAIASDAWAALGSRGKENRFREALFFSPHCQRVELDLEMEAKP